MEKENEIISVAKVEPAGDINLRSSREFHAIVLRAMRRGGFGTVKATLDHIGELYEQNWRVLEKGFWNDADH